MHYERYPCPVGYEDTRTALRDALIVAMAQARMGRTNLLPAEVALSADEYVSAANDIAAAAYPENA